MIKNYLLGLLPKKIAAALWLDKPTLQEYFFRLSLREIGIASWGGVEIDHYNGINWHKKTGCVPLCFPQSMIKEIEKLEKIKTVDYFFSGVITESRNWIRKYPNTHQSGYGRDSAKKYNLDVNYFKQMNSACFGLSPTGDCPWSYRFFESIMCHAIPVLGDTEEDIFSKNFIFMRDSDNHVYVRTAAEKNFNKLINNHTLSSFQAIYEN